jgi:hypothetical protein
MKVLASGKYRSPSIESSDNSRSLHNPFRNVVREYKQEFVFADDELQTFFYDTDTEEDEDNESDTNESDDNEPIIKPTQVPRLSYEANYSSFSSSSSVSVESLDINDKAKVYNKNSDAGYVQVAVRHRSRITETETEISSGDTTAHQD